MNFTSIIFLLYILRLYATTTSLATTTSDIPTKPKPSADNLLKTSLLKVSEIALASWPFYRIGGRRCMQQMRWNGSILPNVFRILTVDVRRAQNAPLDAEKTPRNLRDETPWIASRKASGQNDESEDHA